MKPSLKQYLKACKADRYAQASRKRSQSTYQPVKIQLLTKHILELQKTILEDINQNRNCPNCVKHFEEIQKMCTIFQQTKQKYRKMDHYMSQDDLKDLDRIKNKIINIEQEINRHYHGKKSLKITNSGQLENLQFASNRNKDLNKSMLTPKNILKNNNLLYKSTIDPQFQQK